VIAGWVASAARAQDAASSAAPSGRGHPRLTGRATGLISLMFFRIALGFGEGGDLPTADAGGCSKLDARGESAASPRAWTAFLSPARTHDAAYRGALDDLG